MRLVLVRHLPTPWNRARRLQGRADISIAPLEADDLARVTENRARLESMAPFQKVFCSTLKRTAETARLYGFAACEPTALLDEFDFGRFEGAGRAEFEQAVGRAWLEAPETVALGESVPALEQRIRAFLRVCAGCQSVLAFTHGAWCRAARSLLETGSIQAMNKVSVRNNELLMFDVEPAAFS